MNKAVRDMILIDFVLEKYDQSKDVNIYDLLKQSDQNGDISISGSKLNLSKEHVFDPYGNRYFLVEMDGKIRIAMLMHGGLYVNLQEN
jgi:hypothetical protein